MAPEDAIEYGIVDKILQPERSTREILGDTSANAARQRGY